MGNLHIFIKPYFTHKTVPLNPTKKGMSPTNSFGQILFGEDDLDEVDFLKEIFESINPGYSLLFVNSGKKLIASLAGMEDHFLPKLIVLDYNMPELNGVEILRVLKSDPRYQSIPTIIWSTSGSEYYRKLCLDSGAQDYIIKPSSIKDLESAVKHFLSYCSA